MFMNKSAHPHRVIIYCLSIMTEKQKMLNGERYNCADPELQERWFVAKELLRRYTLVDLRDTAAAEAILDELLGSRGTGVSIAAPFFCDYGEYISIGNNTEINGNCVFLDCNRIEIGSNVLIGPAVQLYAASHPLRLADRLPQAGETFLSVESAPITIEDGVWIGGGSIVLPGVRIGMGSVIGAGSVVTKDIPAGVLALGNPCRVIRNINMD